MSRVAYADTSLLASLYLKDSNTPAAVERLAAARCVVLLTSWQRFELENALRLRIFRREVSLESLAVVEELLRRDLNAGAVVEVTLPLSSTLEEARDLARRHTAGLGTRAFDVFHVAAARQLKARLFLTFDLRQQALARAVGLAAD